MRATQALIDAAQAKAVMAVLWPEICAHLKQGQRLELQIKPEKRSLEQSARMWAMLTELSQQVDWHGQKLEPGEWKDVMTASLKRQKVVPGVDGGFVVLGSSTSRMSKAEMSELMECVAAFGAAHDVEFAEEHA